jgi:hypothetical protein
LFRNFIFLAGGVLHAPIDFHIKIPLIRSGKTSMTRFARRLWKPWAGIRNCISGVGLIVGGGL